MYLPQISAYITIDANISIKQMIDETNRLLIPHSGKEKTHAFFLTHNKDLRKARELLTLIGFFEENASLDATYKKENENGNGEIHLSISDSFKESTQHFLKEERKRIDTVLLSRF